MHKSRLLFVMMVLSILPVAGKASAPLCIAALSSQESATQVSPKRGLAAEETAPAAIVTELAKRQPDFALGLASATSSRDLFQILFSSLPLDLELPLNTESLMTLQSRTGESRSGIDPAWSSYSSLSAILDIGGVFGPLGPLGFNGPVGDKSLNLQEWWKKWAYAGVQMFVPRNVIESGGPLNPDTGILSKVGPDSSDWNQGNFNVLGSNSFAGPKGVLGPLGPIGAVRTLGNYRIDPTGYYIDRDSDRLVTSIHLRFGNHSRTYDVIEHLAGKFSAELSTKWLLDTTYLVDSHLDNSTKTQSFRSTAPQSEIVSVLVVPDVGVTSGNVIMALPKRLNFSLKVLTEQGTEIVKSDLAEKSNLVQFQVRRGEKFEVQVVRQGLGPWGTVQRFRLIVIGSTDQYASFLWQRAMGPEFIRLFEAPKTYDSELALAYLFVEVSRRALNDLKAVVRDGMKVDRPDLFWKKIMSETMARYDLLKTTAPGPVELRPVLIAALERSVAGYKEVALKNPLSPEEFVKAWQTTVGTTSSSAEKIATVDKASIAKIPATWATWMDQVVLAFKKGVTTAP